MARQHQRRRRPGGPRPPKQRVVSADAARKVQTYTDAVAGESALYFSEGQAVVARMHLQSDGKTSTTNNFAYIIKGTQGSFDGKPRTICLVGSFEAAWDIILDTMRITEAILDPPAAIEALTAVRDAIDGRISDLRDAA